MFHQDDTEKSVSPYEVWDNTTAVARIWTGRVRMLEHNRHGETVETAWVPAQDSPVASDTEDDHDRATGTKRKREAFNNEDDWRFCKRVISETELTATQCADILVILGAKMRKMSPSGLTPPLTLKQPATPQKGKP